MTKDDFEKYFRVMYLPLGMYALRIVENTEIAEDVVSEVFSKIWQKLERGEEIENFKTYIYRSVRNDCISYLRKQKETVGLENIPEADEESIDTSERDAKIWKAVEDLPEKCRRVFLLSKRDGLSNEEIAEEMDISIKTVKNQMTKAFSRLREALSDGHKPFFLPFL